MTPGERKKREVISGFITPFEALPCSGYKRGIISALAGNPGFLCASVCNGLYLVLRSL
jgi:hypothetical protein